MSNSNPYYYCNIEGETNVGCKRKQNEDWLDSFESKNGLVAVVCDGMGGHVGGQVASHLAIDSIREFVCGNTFNNPNEMIVEAINVANQAILNRTLTNPELSGMGSTCVMLVVRDGKVYVGSVGDSRVYLVRSKKIIQLTKDQSYVQMLVDMGEITKEQAERHPRRNEITNALGLPTMRPATVLELPIVPEAGDCFLLCSDGLSGMVNDDAIAKIVSSQATMSQRDRVNALINAACANGGNDNITCQIVEFSVSPNGEKKKNGSLLWLWILLSVLLVTLAGTAAAVWYFLQDEDVDESRPRVEYKPSVNDEPITINSDFKFKAGKVVFKIKKNEDDVYELHYKHQKTDSVIILEGVTDLSGMVYKNEMFTTETVGDVITFKFGKEYCGESFSIKFNREDDALVYSFTVVGAPKTTAGNTATSNNEVPAVVEDPVEEPVGEEVEERVSTAFSHFNAPAEKKETVTLSNDSTTVFVVEYSSARSGGSASQYSQTKAPFKATNGVVDKTWYNYEVSGNRCTVTVINALVSEATQTISIPLDNGNYEMDVIKPEE